MSKIIRILTVLHLNKEGFPEDQEILPLVGSNPPLTFPAFLEAHNLMEELRPYGPFSALFCSRLARASEMVSVFSLAYDLDFMSIKALGQHASRDKGRTFWYPGCEGEDYDLWRDNGIAAYQSLAQSCENDSCVLVVGHRPVTAGIFCHAQGIMDPEVIKQVARDPEFRAQRWFLFQVIENGAISILRGDYEIPESFIESSS